MSTDYVARHNQAMKSPLPIPLMINAWLQYAKHHKRRFESEIGKDYVLGDEWAKIGGALISLLNGELGGLDGGTCDHLIRSNLVEQGFKEYE